MNSVNDTSLFKQSIATRVVFLVAGLTMSAWAPLVPFAKSRLSLNEATLGTLLLSLGTGSLIAMPFTGKLVFLYGCKNLIITAIAFILFTLPLLAMVSTLPLMTLCLAMFGAAIGVLDVAMNIQAIGVEKSARRAMMSGFHGFFSIGGFVGASLVSALLWLGLTPLKAILSLLIPVILMVWSHRNALSNVKEHHSGSRLFSLPCGRVLLLGVFCFILFLTEGALLDWSALFLTQVRDMPASHAGTGYAIFSVAMTLGRLSGDRVVKYFGDTRVLFCGSLCAAAGLFIAVSVGNSLVTLAAFFMVGLGAANCVPILFSAAGRQKIPPPDIAISAMTLVGYTGILVGPAFIGGIAHWVNLTAAFILIGLLILVVSACARHVTQA